MKTDMSPERLGELTHTFAENNIYYVIIAGWGLDGVRGEQSRPHQDLDVLCKKEEEKKVISVVESLGYEMKNRFSDLCKYFRADGGKIDLAFVTQEKEFCYTNGKTALTRFPKHFFTTRQDVCVNGVAYYVASNEMLKIWGAHSRTEADRTISAALPVDETAMKRVVRELKK